MKNNIFRLYFWKITMIHPIILWYSTDAQEMKKAGICPLLEQALKDRFRPFIRQQQHPATWPNRKSLGINPIQTLQPFLASTSATVDASTVERTFRPPTVDATQRVIGVAKLRQCNPTVLTKLFALSDNIDPPAKGSLPAQHFYALQVNASKVCGVPRSVSPQRRLSRATTRRRFLCKY